MLKKIFGSALFGVEAFTIAIEVNVDKGIGYHLVGLPDNAIKESNFRIAAALQNNSYKIPGKKLTAQQLLTVVKLGLQLTLLNNKEL